MIPSCPAHGSTSGTYNLLHYSLAKIGIEDSCVKDPDDLDSWQAVVQPNTKSFFSKTISNPQIDLLDTPGVAEIAHANGLPLTVDNTVATPYLTQGINTLVHSATKYPSGPGAVIVRMIVDDGTFGWTQGHFPEFITPNPNYQGGGVS